MSSSEMSSNWYKKMTDKNILSTIYLSANSAKGPFNLIILLKIMIKKHHTQFVWESFQHIIKNMIKNEC